MPRAAEAGEFGLQLRHFRTEDELAMGQDRLQPSAEIGGDAVLLGFKVEERWVVTVELANRPGTLGTSMDILALKGININYCYYSVTDGTSAYVVLGVADPLKVESLLKKRNQGTIPPKPQ